MRLEAVRKLVAYRDMALLLLKSFIVGTGRTDDFPQQQHEIRRHVHRGPKGRTTEEDSGLSIRSFGRT